MGHKQIFQDHTVLITGAGAGIGKVLVQSYAREGACVIAVDRDQQKLEETAAIMEAEGLDVLCYTVDVSKPELIEPMFSDIDEKQGKLDIVINNAGLGIWKHPFDLGLDEWDYVLNTNLRGTFLCTREAAKLMRKYKRGGSIINMSSTRALMSEPNSEAYAASKGGILALTHAMAVSLGKERIRVNAICPGWIETGEYNNLRQVDHDQHPAHRVGRPEDIVKACFYLSDPDNDFVTGTQLVVDGGMTRKMMYEE